MYFEDPHNYEKDVVGIRKDRLKALEEIVETAGIVVKEHNSTWAWDYKVVWDLESSIKKLESLK